MSRQDAVLDVIFGTLLQARRQAVVTKRRHPFSPGRNGGVVHTMHITIRVVQSFLCEICTFYRLTIKRACSHRGAGCQIVGVKTNTRYRGKQCCSRSLEDDGYRCGWGCTLTTATRLLNERRAKSRRRSKFYRSGARRCWSSCGGKSEKSPATRKSRTIPCCYPADATVCISIASNCLRINALSSGDSAAIR